MEIQSAEWNGYGCRPTIARDLGRRMPEPIPTRINDGIALGWRSLFNDLAVSLRAQRIYFEDVSVAMTQSWIDHDGEVVIEVHGKITAQLSGNDRSRGVVVAANSEVHVMGVVQDANFGFLCGRAGLKGLPLPEVGNRGCGLPYRIVQSPIQARCVISVCRGSSIGKTLRSRQDGPNDGPTGDDEQQCSFPYSWRPQEFSPKALDEPPAGLSWRVPVFTNPVPPQTRIKGVIGGAGVSLLPELPRIPSD